MAKPIRTAEQLEAMIVLLSANLAECAALAMVRIEAQEGSPSWRAEIFERRGNECARALGFMIEALQGEYDLAL